MCRPVAPGVPRATPMPLPPSLCLSRSPCRRLSAGIAALLSSGLLAGSALAQAVASCSSDGRPPPIALIERFMPADCLTCWTDKPLSSPSRGAVVLDWVLPSDGGDDAPMSAVARREALERLAALNLPPPEADSATPLQHRSQRAGRDRVRVQHGMALGGYIGASLRFEGRRNAAGPYTGWLALVEWLPAGMEGSPVARQLVRNLLTEPIAPRPSEDWPYQLWRPMNVPDGAQPSRLGVVGWVTDAKGHMVALAQAHCPETP